MEICLQLAKMVVESVHQSWNDLWTLSIPYRVEQLQALKRMLEENTVRFEEALWKDLRKPRQETHMSEINLILSDIGHALHNLWKWTSPHNAERGLLHQFDMAYVTAEPYGMALIVAPWNYPIGLLLDPLVGAIAAGNACVLKPSELSVATSNLLKELVPLYLDQDLYTVITGGVGVATEILKNSTSSSQAVQQLAK
jgi:acyl-CoA reductase-like NAD-dependent aldehyde dehydrogenase